MTFDLSHEACGVWRQLEVSFRRPTAWKLVSESVRRAEAGDPSTRTLGELYAAYQALAGSWPRELGPRGRLAEQVYRLGASRCVDGCRGCLHRPSPLMSDSQAAVLVSRDLLARSREFVLEPVTAVVAGRETVRVLADPEVTDAHAAALRGGGFTGGGFDPLLRRVVWVRGPEASDRRDG